MTDNNSAPELLAVVGNLLRQHKLGGWPVTDQQWKTLDEAYRRRADLCAADRGVTVGAVKAALEEAADKFFIAKFYIRDEQMLKCCDEKIAEMKAVAAALQPAEAQRDICEKCNGTSVAGHPDSGYTCDCDGGMVATPPTDNTSLVEDANPHPPILPKPIKRFEFWLCQNDGGMQEKPYGEWVSHEDHVKEIERLLAALASREAPPAVTVDD